MKVAQEIQEKIEQYRELALDGSNLQELLDLRKELVFLSFQLGREVASYKRAYDASYAKRKISYNSHKSQFLKKFGVGASETYAEVKVKELRQEEALNEGVWTGLRTILNQANKTLESLQQDISIIKHDLHETTEENTQGAGEVVPEHMK